MSGFVIVICVMLIMFAALGIILARDEPKESLAFGDDPDVESEKLKQVPIIEKPDDEVLTSEPEEIQVVAPQSDIDEILDASDESAAGDVAVQNVVTDQLLEPDEPIEDWAIDSTSDEAALSALPEIPAESESVVTVIDETGPSTDVTDAVVTRERSEPI